MIHDKDIVILIHCHFFFFPSPPKKHYTQRHFWFPWTLSPSRILFFTTRALSTTCTCFQICLLDWMIAMIHSLYPRAQPLHYTTGSYLLVTSHMALGMLLGLWVAHSLMNQAHIVAIFRTGANASSASSHMKKKSTRN